MTLANLPSRTSQGMDAPRVRVEVDVGAGRPSFSVVGLLESVVKESKDRVRAALVNCGREFPVGRVTVNPAPADLLKGDGRFDLAIAVGILVAAVRLPAGSFHGTELNGERLPGGTSPYCSVRVVYEAQPAGATSSTCFAGETCQTNRLTRAQRWPHALLSR